MQYPICPHKLSGFNEYRLMLLTREDPSSEMLSFKITRRAKEKCAEKTLAPSKVMERSVLLNFGFIFQIFHTNFAWLIISDWQPNLTHEDDHLLVQSGRDEMKQLGQRFKARFPTLFDKFDPKEVVVSQATNRRSISTFLIPPFFRDNSIFSITFS